MCTPSERRRAGRLRCVNVTCQIGEVLDLSASGIQIRAHRYQRIKVGDVVRLELRYMDQQVYVKGLTVRVEKKLLSKPLIGMIFQDVMPGTAQKLAMLALSGGDNMSLYRGGYRRKEIDPESDGRF